MLKIIAEVKTHSPFGWKSELSWDELFQIADRATTQEGDMISIHTDPRWHGSMDRIRQARKLTSKPILAKGIHATDEEIVRAIEAGADYVLVVGRMPNVHLHRCLIEPNTIEELRELAPTIKAVWNSRDLTTGGLKDATFSDARKVFQGDWLCQASNIASVKDIDQAASAILVGTHLPAIAGDLILFREKAQPSL